MGSLNCATTEEAAEIRALVGNENITSLTIWDLDFPKGRRRWESVSANFEGDQPPLNFDLTHQANKKLAKIIDAVAGDRGHTVKFHLELPDLPVKLDVGTLGNDTTPEPATGAPEPEYIGYSVAIRIPPGADIRAAEGAWHLDTDDFGFYDTIEEAFDDIVEAVEHGWVNTDQLHVVGLVSLPASKIAEAFERHRQREDLQLD